MGEAGRPYYRSVESQFDSLPPVSYRVACVGKPCMVSQPLLPTRVGLCKQAAAFLLAELIEGVEEAVWEVLPDWLSLLYRTLKHAAEAHRRPAVNGAGGGAWDDDVVTQRHAERGLMALDERARAFLFPPTKVHHPKIL